MSANPHVHPAFQHALSAATARPAIVRIAELELEVANCRRLIAETRDQLNALCPADSVAVMPDGAEILADESVVQEAAAWVLGKHSVEFAEQINERQLAYFAQQRAEGQLERALNRIEDRA